MLYVYDVLYCMFCKLQNKINSNQNQIKSNHPVKTFYILFSDRADYWVKLSNFDRIPFLISMGSKKVGSGPVD